MELAPFILIPLGLVAAWFACTGLEARERRFAMAAFGLHLIAAFGQWALLTFYYGYGDALAYMEKGGDLARFLDYDFEQYAPALLKLILHLESGFPTEVFGEGSSSGTMAGLGGALAFVVGPSLLSANLITTWVSWFGQLCWYRVAREELRPLDKTPLLVGLLLVPSAIFWCALFAKESLVAGAFGLLGLSLYRAVRNRRVSFVPGIVVGVVSIALLKAFTLLPFILAVGAFVYADRTWRRGEAIQFRPFSLLLAALLSLGGVAAFAKVFPQYDSSNITQTVTRQQAAWDPEGGRSSFQNIGGEAATEKDELALAPVALVNSFFRPFLFEARGGPAVGAALETTLFTLAVLSMLGSARRVAREVLRSPFLLASAVFVLIFAFAVGLTTSNLGSLSRYRVTMMPLYAAVVLVVRERLRERAASTAPRGSFTARRSSSARLA